MVYTTGRYATLVPTFQNTSRSDWNCSEKITMHWLNMGIQLYK